MGRSRPDLVVTGAARTNRRLQAALRAVLVPVSTVVGFLGGQEYFADRFQRGPQRDRPFNALVAAVAPLVAGVAAFRACAPLSRGLLVGARAIHGRLGPR